VDSKNFVYRIIISYTISLLLFTERYLLSFIYNI
jgi:hypothetical protein